MHIVYVNNQETNEGKVHRLKTLHTGNDEFLRTCFSGQRYKVMSIRYFTQGNLGTKDCPCHGV